MRDLTATFGIIAAAVVGYYFGQKNLEEATKTAKTATVIAEQAKDEAEGGKRQLKREKKERVSALKKAVPIYEDAKKFISLAAPKIPPQDLESISKEVDVKSLEVTLDDRLTDVKKTLETKEKEVDDIESSTRE